jgi:hypothetical protein
MYCCLLINSYEHETCNSLDQDIVCHKESKGSVTFITDFPSCWQNFMLAYCMRQFIFHLEIFHPLCCPLRPIPSIILLEVNNSAFYRSLCVSRCTSKLKLTCLNITVFASVHIFLKLLCLSFQHHTIFCHVF